MPNRRASVLVIADERPVAARLLTSVRRLGYREVSVVAFADATDALKEEGLPPATVTILGIASDGEPDLQLASSIVTRSASRAVAAALSLEPGAAERARRRLSPLMPVADVADERALAAAIRAALQPAPATLLDRRRVWELEIVNETAHVIGRSLELEVVLAGALDRLITSLGAAGGSIRLLNDATGEYEVKAQVGPANIAALWLGDPPPLFRPSDRAIATRAAVVVDDLADFAPRELVDRLPVRSGISVPMLVQDGLIGTLSLAGTAPYEFGKEEEALLGIIGSQIGVAVQNARLHDSISRGKREWEHTFDAISDPIAVFDSRGILLRGNTALAAVLGRRVTELSQITCQVVGFCGGGCPRCSVCAASALEGPGRAEVTRADGQIFSVTTFPVAGEGKSASVVQVAKNVTEEIRAARQLRLMRDELASANGRLTATVEQLRSTQAQLLQSDKLAAIGQLVAGVAHELNNPLTSVIGYAQLLEEELLDASAGDALRAWADLAQDLRHIVDESERAARIVRNLLAFARRQTAERIPQQIVELATRVLSLRAYDLRLNAIDLQTSFEPRLPAIVADGGQIQQALLNLILNAEQAMRGRALRRLTVAARLDARAAAVELSVTDTGHGIDPTNLTRIFDPFFTTRDVGDGTGLGLSICYGIIRDHGGQIQVESRVQAGTTFSILLPAQLADGGLASAGILVAHPEQGDRDFIAAALTAWGGTVASTGEPAEALARYRAGGLQAALVDRGILAANVDGWTAVRSAADPQTPLILLSRAPDDSPIDRFGREQASAILTPPFQLRALWSAVRAVVKEYV